MQQPVMKPISLLHAGSVASEGTRVPELLAPHVLDTLARVGQSSAMSGTFRPLEPATVFGIAMGAAFIFGALIVVALSYVCRARRRLGDPESDAKSLAIRRRSATGIIAFSSDLSSKEKMLVVPPLKDPPPVATTRYEGHFARAVPHPAPGEPSLPAPQSRRCRPSDMLGKSPPRRKVLVVSNR
ncbi:hypothetical protein B0H15DRAFT_847921 [Mycena belliarum]|uniref:Uncharacterized protein n=1 Tax=Mycena belliarum TaxID=1033014 RepID=A0AAD6U0S6_9AGAR|nr:hypothetical protein B0H15DRAFT_847921 [Mycena belliae]